MTRIGSIALAALLVACSTHGASDATTHASGPPARIDLARAVAAHPLASMLREYDQDLATLRIARDARGLTDIPARVAADVADADRIVDAAARQTAALTVRTPQLPAAAETAPDRGAAAVATYRDALSRRNARALELRASQLRESEADAAYEFDRAHAGARLQLRVKLRNLHLDPDRRRELQTELDAMQAQEDAIVARLRRANAATLADFSASLEREGNSDLTELAGDVLAHRQAAAQLGSAHRTPAPELSLDDRAEAAQAYRANGPEIARRLDDVSAQDRSASARVRAAVAELQRARSAIRTEIVASIESTARSVAAQRGLGRVYETGAPSGANDLTAAVIASVRAATQ